MAISQALRGWIRDWRNRFGGRAVGLNDSEDVHITPGGAADFIDKSEHRTAAALEATFNRDTNANP